MKKFITPVTMKVTEEQYNNDLRGKLLEFGYEESNVEFSANYDILFNDFNFNFNTLFVGNNVSINLCGRFHIETYNPKLYLALAAMTEGEVPIVGEWMIRVKTNKNGKKGDLFIVNIVSNYNATDIGQIDIRNPTGAGSFRKATKEELIAKFSDGVQEDKVPELKFNTWYKNNSSYAFRTSIHSSNIGFHRRRQKYFTSLYCNSFDYWQEVKLEEEKELQELLLNKAKKDYPIGTKYISEGSIEEINRNLDIYVNKDSTNAYYITDGYGGFVFSHGKFAKIVSKTDVGSDLGVDKTISEKDYLNLYPATPDKTFKTIQSKSNTIAQDKNTLISVTLPGVKIKKVEEIKQIKLLTEEKLLNYGN